MTHLQQQTRQQALDTIQSLINDFNLTPRDVMALYQQEQSESGGLLQRVMIYIGGVLVFMGLCVYIGMIWNDLNPLARVIVSLGSGLVAFTLGMIANGDKRFVRASTPLFIVAAALIPTGLFVFMDEYLPHSGDKLRAACVVFGFTMFQNAVGFATTRRTSLLFFSLFFFYAFLSVFMMWLEIDAPQAPLIMGLTGFLVCWGLDKTPHAAISPFYYFWASIVTAAASYDFLAHGPLDVLLIGVSSCMIYLCTLNGSRTLLTVGVISLLAYLGYFTDEYFKNIVGWPIALIVMGFVMMGVSVFAVKLGRKIARKGA